MTKVTVEIGDKTYSFEGEDVADAMKKIKYSRVPFSLLRAMGIKWTRKILWPTFQSLQNRGMNVASAEIELPRTLTSILKQKSDGNLDASVDMELDSEKFNASATGRFSSDALELEFKSQISEPDDTGNALKEGFKLLSSYNVVVEEVKFEIDPQRSSKTAKVSVNTDVPENLRKERISGA